MAANSAETVIRTAGSLLARWRSLQALRQAGRVALAQQHSPLQQQQQQQQPQQSPAHAAGATSAPQQLPPPWAPAHWHALTTSSHTQEQEPQQPGAGGKNPSQQQHGDSGRPQQPAPSSQSWLERALPPAALPYAHLMRLEKPIGTYLLAWPGLWSIALAAPAGQLPDPWLSSLFVVGAVVSQ
jgi:hypothetical protein